MICYIAFSRKGRLSHAVITRHNMTAQNASRSSTLADVLEVVAHAKLDEKPRAEIASSLRTIGRILARPLAQISVDSDTLRHRLNAVSYLAVGMSRGRWANIRSHLHAALQLAKEHIVRPSKPPMSPAWVGLYQRLPKAGRMRVGRLLRFLSDQQTGLALVTSEHLEAFHQSLLNDPLMKNPEKTWRLAVGAWNSARRRIPDWPDLEVRLTPRKDTYGLPWDTFPASFKADADAFLAKIAGSDFLDETAGRPVRQSTVEMRRRQILHFGVCFGPSGHSPERHSDARRPRRVGELQVNLAFLYGAARQHLLDDDREPCALLEGGGAPLGQSHTRIARKAFGHRQKRIGAEHWDDAEKSRSPRPVQGRRESPSAPSLA